MLLFVIEQIASSIMGLIAGFFLGTAFGWFMRGITGSEHAPGVTGKQVAVTLVNTIVVVLWTASVINTIFQFNDATTPWFLHACMGGVMGYLNESFGSWMIKVLGRDHNPVKQ